LPFTTICPNLSGTVEAIRRESGPEPVGDLRPKLLISHHFAWFKTGTLSAR
jgi:hypothetical protein